MACQRDQPVKAPAEPPVVVAVRAELVRALAIWRWCWECGTSDLNCHASMNPAGKCCPDCRHRDAGHVVLARVLAPPGFFRPLPTVDRIAAALHEPCTNTLVDHIIGLPCLSPDNHRDHAQIVLNLLLEKPE